MAEYGIDGTGKTWVAEAPAPLALAERIGVRRMQEQQAAERARIQLAKQKQTQQALDDAARNKAIEGGGYDAGLYSAPFSEFQNQKMKELMGEQGQLATPDLIRKANLLKTNLQNTAFKYKNATEAAQKQISGLPTEFYDPAGVQAELQNEIQTRYKPGMDMFTDTPQAEDLVQAAKGRYRNIRGGNIGNKVAGMIESNINETASKNALGKGYDFKTQTPLAFKRTQKGDLIPDAAAFNQLFMSQTAGPEFVNSYEAELLKDPASQYAVLKTGLDKQLAAGTITQDAYNESMENNRFAHVVVPQLGGLKGLPTRFPQLSSIDNYAAQLTEDARKKLEYRKPPQESKFVFNVPGNPIYKNGKIVGYEKTGYASYNNPTLTVVVPPSEQDASERFSLGSAKVYIPSTGKFRKLNEKEFKAYAPNNGMADNNIDLVPEFVLREKMNFKAVDKKGNVVKLDYNPSESETFDPVLLGKAFDKAGGVKLIAKGMEFDDINRFLSDSRKVSVEPLFRVKTLIPSNTRSGDPSPPVAALFFPAKTKSELLRRWNDYSTKSVDDIMEEWKSLPVKALDQYRGKTRSKY